MIQAFAIHIIHTSFQLYHCTFLREYLEQVHDKGEISSDTGVTLHCTPLYNFCIPQDRKGWVDIFIALVEYLRSGESKVGFLNKKIRQNLLNKVVSLVRLHVNGRMLSMKLKR